MRVTEKQFKARSSQFLHRAAAGKPVTVELGETGAVRIAPVKPASEFDPALQKKVFAEMAATRKRLAARGLGISSREIRRLIQQGRR